MKNILIGAVSLFLIGSAAHAVPLNNQGSRCADAYSVYNNRAMYGEVPVANGNSYDIDNATGLLRLRGMTFFLNRVTGTWSLVHTYVNGVACIEDYGNAYVPILR